MKRKWLAALCLLMAAALLSGCTAQQPTTQTFAEVTQYLGVAPTATPEPVDQPADDQSVFASNPYALTDENGTPASYPGVSLSGELRLLPRRNRPGGLAQKRVASSCRGALGGRQRSGKRSRRLSSLVRSMRSRTSVRYSTGFTSTRVHETTSE